MVENLDESDQFTLGRDFIRIFDVTTDLNNAMFRIQNSERKYVIKRINLIMANENKAPVFLSRRVRLKANAAAIVKLRMKNYNELSDNKQLCIDRIRIVKVLLFQEDNSRSPRVDSASVSC